MKELTNTLVTESEVSTPLTLNLPLDTVLKESISVHIFTTYMAWLRSSRNDFTA